MNWLRETITDSGTGKASAKRVSMLIATLALAVAAIVCACASLLGHDIALALGAVSVPLAGLGGYNYVNGKVAEYKGRAQTASVAND